MLVFKYNKVFKFSLFLYKPFLNNFSFFLEKIIIRSSLVYMIQQLWQKRLHQIDNDITGIITVDLISMYTQFSHKRVG